MSISDQTSCRLAVIAGLLIILAIASAPIAAGPDTGEATFWGDQSSIGGRMPVESQLRVPGSVLRPRTSDPTFSSISGGCIYAESNGTTVWNAPVYLPQGATVNAMRFYFFDGSVASDAWAWLTAYDYQGNIFQEWGAQSFGSSGSGYVTIDPIDHVVDYSSYSYVVNWRPVAVGSSMQVCGFRFWYTTP